MALQTFLETFITTKLEAWQGTDGTDGIRNFAIDALISPSSNPYKPAFDSANTRLSDITTELAKELKAGTISHLVVPRYAALVFEGFFNACVAFWIARGQPPPPAQNVAQVLKPEVTRFVELQVRLFMALVGAK